jgi:hypothetical protein
MDRVFLQRERFVILLRETPSSHAQRHVGSKYCSAVGSYEYRRAFSAATRVLRERVTNPHKV